jgi:hypothetical protein
MKLYIFSYLELTKAQEEYLQICFLGGIVRKLLQIIALALTLAFFVTISAAQNNMPLMQSFVGSVGNSWFGKEMATLDFNADGYCDLAVFSNSGIDNSITRADLFYGGTVMDTIVDLSRVSQFLGQVCPFVFLNCGDINGDNYEDLMIMERYEAVNDSCALRIFYGGPNADMIPDYTITTSMWSGYPKIMPGTCLGDVNGDGYDDMGILYWNSHYYPDLAILLGGTFQIITVKPFVDFQRRYSITGAGDVNNDGFDDYLVGYAIYTQNILTTYRYLYYGGNPINLNNRVLLRELADDGYWNFPGGYGIGDFNGDGFDDFIYCNGDSYRDNNKLRLGGTDIVSTTELTLHCHDMQPNLMDMERQGIAYGDFNGDGYSDVAGTDFEVITWTGNAGVWLGRAIPNGQYDLRITTPATSPFHQFGWQVDSGDFNGDGFCDLVISAPHSDDSIDPIYPGFVYIFAGNAQLADTTVGNDEEAEPTLQDKIRVRYYPNPGSSNIHEIHYEVEGKLPYQVLDASISLHNIKGQVVHHLDLDQKSLQSRKGTLSINKLKPGIYIATLDVNSTRVSAEKITIK